MALYLVRHGRPILDPAAPASTWVLDPEHEHLVTDLAARAPWPDDAVWFTSPEPKAARTAFLDGFSLGLQNVVPGDLLDVADTAQVQAAGELLATLHVELAAYPDVVPAASSRSG